MVNNPFPKPMPFTFTTAYKLLYDRKLVQALPVPFNFWSKNEKVPIFWEHVKTVEYL